MASTVSRRRLLMEGGWSAGALGLAALGAAVPASCRAADKPAGAPRRQPFGFCLNSSTLFGQKLNIVQLIEIASKAGYDGMEPWMHEIEAYTKGGGSIDDLARRFRDGGIEVAGLIAFPRWADADAGVRKAALEEARRHMETARKLGCRRIAAPPAGNVAGVTLFEAAERYRALLEVGKSLEVIPSVELWGFAKILSRLSEVAYVVIDSGDPEACTVLDVYHLYKGGGGAGGLKHFAGASISIVHINDYPADPPRERIEDRQRVFPGDGVAPLGRILKDLQAIGYRGMLSLELFNDSYYKRDAFEVAKEGLEKIRAAVEKALQG